MVDRKSRRSDYDIKILPGCREYYTVRLQKFYFGDCTHLGFKNCQLTIGPFLGVQKISLYDIVTIAKGSVYPSLCGWDLYRTASSIDVSSQDHGNESLGRTSIWSGPPGLFLGIVGPYHPRQCLLPMFITSIRWKRDRSHCSKTDRMST